MILEEWRRAGARVPSRRRPEGSSLGNQLPSATALLHLVRYNGANAFEEFDYVLSLARFR